MSLFNDDRQPPRQPRPARPGLTWSQRVRTPSFWLWVAFVVILLGSIFAYNQPWFIVAVVLWVIAIVIIGIRSSRNQPPPPNLFDD